MVICQKEKCKEMHFIITKQLYKYNGELNEELSKNYEKINRLEKIYKELRKNYTKDNIFFERLKNDKKNT